MIRVVGWFLREGWIISTKGVAYGHVEDRYGGWLMKEGIVNLTQVWQTGVMKTKTPSYHRHRFPVWSNNSSSLAGSETLTFFNGEECIDGTTISHGSLLHNRGITGLAGLSLLLSLLSRPKE